MKGKSGNMPVIIISDGFNVFELRCTYCARMYVTVCVPSIIMFVETTLDDDGDPFLFLFGYKLRIITDFVHISSFSPFPLSLFL